jgi:hypothetical protein
MSLWPAFAAAQDQMKGQMPAQSNLAAAYDGMIVRPAGVQSSWHPGFLGAVQPDHWQLAHSGGGSTTNLVQRRWTGTPSKNPMTEEAASTRRRDIPDALPRRLLHAVVRSEILARKFLCVTNADRCPAIKPDCPEEISPRMCRHKNCVSRRSAANLFEHKCFPP